MDEAIRARQKNHPEQELDHLKKAVLIDPEYIAARNNLAVCLMAVEPSSAIAELEEAIKVDPRKGVLFSNLAVVYALTHNWEAAERAARRSIELDRTAGQARALLGLVLYEQRKYTAEVSALLERASDEYPMTHVFAAKVLMARGEFQKARIHALAYLSGGETEYREHASGMLDSIDHMESDTKIVAESVPAAAHAR